MKRYLSIVLVFLMGVMIPVSALAAAGEQRVAIGANLDETQIAQVYSDFGIERGNVTEITVTNADERKYLEGVADESKIGSMSISCVYITILDEGAGLSVTTKNINWCTEEMYVNALTTAGITDAKVAVTAPFAVSGTAALTGIYKAYEDIYGVELSELAKSIGVEELITTGELSEYIGSDEATEIINELKGMLDTTQNMSDSDVLAEINRIAEDYNVVITDGQANQLLSLCRQLEKLDTDELKQKLISMTEAVEKASSVKQTLTETTEKVKNFFASVGSFFTNLFGN